MSNSTELQVLLFLCLVTGLAVSQAECGTNNNSTSQPRYNVRCTSIIRNTNKYTLEVEYPGYPRNYECATEQLLICDEACTYCIELVTKSGNESKLTTTNTINYFQFVMCTGNDTACKDSDSEFLNASYDTCRLNSTNQTTTTCMKDDSNVSARIQIQTTALITLCCVLTVLLVMVTTCWICTYRKMKRRIRALEMTPGPLNYR